MAGRVFVVRLWRTFKDMREPPILTSPCCSRFEMAERVFWSCETILLMMGRDMPTGANFHAATLKAMAPGGDLELKIFWRREQIFVLKLLCFPDCNFLLPAGTTPSPAPPRSALAPSSLSPRDNKSFSSAWPPSRTKSRSHSWAPPRSRNCPSYGGAPS